MIYCKQCATVFRGRTDKKFCNGRCRATYNYNLRRTPKRNIVKEVDQALKQNRRILRSLCTSGKETVKKELLVSRGFEFAYYTSIAANANNSRLYFYCYDMAYSFISTSDLLIIYADRFRNLDEK